VARSADDASISEQLITGALRLITDEGPGDLSVRRLAQAGNRSTMCVYTKFGSRQGLLAAVYDRAAAEFLAVLRAAPRELTALAETYRAEAARSPGMYAFLFEQYPASLGLSSAPRASLIGEACALITAAARVGRDEATSTWATLHGLVSLQQTGQTTDLATERTPWPARFLDLLNLCRQPDRSSSQLPAGQP